MGSYSFSKVAAGARRFTLGLIVASLTAGPGYAQQISRTSDYTATWSGSNFGDASALYAGSNAYGPGSFTNNVFTFTPLSNAANLVFNDGGGVTISSPALQPPTPYASSYPVTFSNSGSDGYWGWTYNTAATTSGPALTLGKLGTLSTLAFDVGGGQGGTFTSPIDFYANVFLPGNWTTEGTSTGDYFGLSANPGFSTSLSYDSMHNVTTISAVDDSFAGGSGGAIYGPGLEFTLVGSAVPEPSTWAMLLFGFGGLGFVGYRRGLQKAATVLAAA
jgi:hypothetical protein